MPPRAPADLRDDELAVRLSRNRRWLRRHAPGDPHYAEVAAYGLRLEEEARHRGLAGTGSATTSGTLAAAGTTGADSDVPRLDRAIATAFADPGVTGLEAFKGRLGELGVLHQSPLRSPFRLDLNLRPWGPRQQLGWFPIWDVEDRWSGELIQSKFSTRETPSGRLSYALKGLRDTSGDERPRTFARARAEFPARTDADLILSGRLSVARDDAAWMRESIQRDIVQLPENYRRLIDAHLGREPLVLERPGAAVAPRFVTLEELERARTANLVTDGEQNALLGEVAGRIVEAVEPNPLSVAEGRRLVRYRGRFTYGSGSQSPESIAAQVVPQDVLTARSGGYLIGLRTQVGRAGATAGAIALVTQTGIVLLDSKRYPEVGDVLVPLARAGTAGVASGATGATVESLATQLVPRGYLSGWSTSGLGGSVAAPVAVFVELGLDDRPHTGSDYAAKGTRAAAGGAFSGAVSAGVVGAVWGTEVPIAGNIAGFAIGFGAYLIFDSLLGDAIEGEVRDVVGDEEHAVDEALGPPPVVRTSIAPLGPPALDPFDLWPGLPLAGQPPFELRPSDPFRTFLRLPGTRASASWSFLDGARARGVDVDRIAGRHGIDLELPVEWQLDALPRDERERFALRLEGAALAAERDLLRLRPRRGSNLVFLRGEDEGRVPASDGAGR